MRKIVVVMFVVARKISAIRITRLQKIEAIGGPQQHERMITTLIGWVLCRRFLVIVIEKVSIRLKDTKTYKKTGLL